MYFIPVNKTKMTHPSTSSKLATVHQGKAIWVVPGHGRMSFVSSDIQRLTSWSKLTRRPKLNSWPKLINWPKLLSWPKLISWLKLISWPKLIIRPKLISWPELISWPNLISCSVGLHYTIYRRTVCGQARPVSKRDAAADWIPHVTYNPRLYCSPAHIPRAHLGIVSAMITLCWGHGETPPCDIGEIRRSQSHAGRPPVPFCCCFFEFPAEFLFAFIYELVTRRIWVSYRVSSALYWTRSGGE